MSQALDALKEGIVDGLGGLSETLTHIEEFKLVERAQAGMSGKIAYGQLKEEMWKETRALLEQASEESIITSDRELQYARARKRREAQVEAWETSKAKL